MNADTITIKAISITPHTITYECPDCKTKYKKNGSPFKNAKPVLHTHGNEEKSAENRTVYRSHHAVREGMNTFKNVEIVIDDSALKFGFNGLIEEMQVDPLII
jgi:hypothetical protein